MADTPKTSVAPGADVWSRYARLRCDFSAEVPLPWVKLANLLELHPGAVIDSHWKVGSDVPARVNGVVIAWSEFEVVSGKLAVRITDLA